MDAKAGRTDQHASNASAGQTSRDIQNSRGARSRCKGGQRRPGDRKACQTEEEQIGVRRHHDQIGAAASDDNNRRLDANGDDDADASDHVIKYVGRVKKRARAHVNYNQLVVISRCSARRPGGGVQRGAQHATAGLRDSSRASEDAKSQALHRGRSRRVGRRFSVAAKQQRK